MKKRHLLNILQISVLMFGLFSCATIPNGATAVTPFDKEKYLGKWYEIARFDVKFERNLNNTTAEYSLNQNGTLKVINRGYHTQKKEWREAIGKAKFIGDENLAMLKVSFFGPFYGGYNVIAIDEDYQYSLVAGGSLDYLWILSRKPSIPEDVKTNYLAIAKKLGYETSKLLWVHHDASEKMK